MKTKQWWREYNQKRRDRLNQYKRMKYRESHPVKPRAVRRLCVGGHVADCLLRETDEGKSYLCDPCWTKYQAQQSTTQ